MGNSESNELCHKRAEKEERTPAGEDGRGG